MERNYFIKRSYRGNSVIETIKHNYWNLNRFSQNYYFRYYLFKDCKRLIKKKKINSILDIGCGPATKLMKIIFPKCKNVYGIDTEHTIRICKKLYNHKNFYPDNIENSKLNLKKKFDIIICSDVIEHLLNPDNLINYIKKYCKKATYIIITTPERDILRGQNCNYSPKREHIREWNTKEFKKYLENWNFKILWQGLIESFRILINFKQPFTQIKNDIFHISSLVNRYNYLNKIKHCQLVICKLKNNDESDRIVNKIFDNKFRKVIRDTFNSLLIRVYVLLSKLRIFS